MSHTPTAAMLVIGDEILSGRTRDSNMNHLAKALTEHGIALSEARMISDDHSVIVRHVRELSKAYDHVFTSGGIGPTHDDITAEAVADAMEAACGIRDDARAILQAHYDKSGQELNEARLRMARIPDGATLIDNPVSAAPGFTLGNVHVMAGVPKVFEAMVQSLLPTLTGGAPMVSASLRIERGEGDIAGPLGYLAKANPDVSLGSYPFHQKGIHGSNIVARSQDAAAVEQVMDALRARFTDAATTDCRITAMGDLVPVLERSWPPARTYRNGPFIVMDPDGGGNRVTAARQASQLDEPVTDSDLDAAEAQMREQGRAPLFMVLDNQTKLNDALEARGYIARDHTDAMIIRAADIAATPPPVTAFSIWPPLAIQTEIWEAGGVDAARLAVMDRAVHCTKTSLLGRINDKPAGAAYIGILHGVAMLHALEIAPDARRRGLAVHMMRLAAQWSLENGAEWLSILVTQQNGAAQGLYASLGMKPVGSYHYREKVAE